MPGKTIRPLIRVQIPIRGTDNSWPERLPVYIDPGHFEIGDEIWFVFVASTSKDYKYYMGKAYVRGVEQETRSTAGTYGMEYRRHYGYKLADSKGRPVLHLEERWFADVAVFATKREAIMHAKGAIRFKLDRDAKYHSDCLAIINAAKARLKDDTIALEIGAIGEE
jgi:hypothetical protein